MTTLHTPSQGGCRGHVMVNMDLHVLLACPGVGHINRGYERATQMLARELGARPAELRVSVARGGGSWRPTEGYRVPCLHREGAVVSRLSGSGESAYTMEQRSFALPLYLLIRALQPHVIHLHDPQVLNLLWHTRKRMGGHYKLIFTNGGWLSPDHLWRADHIHCLTPVDADRMHQGGHQSGRVSTIPYGVDLPANSALLSGDSLRVIGVGALEKAKGVHVAIRAVADVHPSASLTFLGQVTRQTPELLGLCQQRLGPRGRLLTVAPEDVTPALQAANVMVLPTVSEGFGMAVLEAMAVGLPCVVSDLPVLRWLVGDAGILLPPDDVPAWTAALRSLDANRRAELGRRARLRAAELSWSALTPQYLAMYRAARHGASGGRPTAAGASRFHA